MSVSISERSLSNAVILVLLITSNMGHVVIGRWEDEADLPHMFLIKSPTIELGTMKQRSCCWSYKQLSLVVLCLCSWVLTARSLWLSSLTLILNPEPCASLGQRVLLSSDILIPRQGTSDIWPLDVPLVTVISLSDKHATSRLHCYC